MVGGALVDFWGLVDRGIATCIFLGATFIGLVAGMSEWYYLQSELQKTELDRAHSRSFHHDELSNLEVDRTLDRNHELQTRHCRILHHP